MLSENAWTAMDRPETNLPPRPLFSQSCPPPTSPRKRMPNGLAPPQGFSLSETRNGSFNHRKRKGYEHAPKREGSPGPALRGIFFCGEASRGPPTVKSRPPLHRENGFDPFFTTNECPLGKGTGNLVLKHMCVLRSATQSLRHNPSIYQPRMATAPRSRSPTLAAGNWTNWPDPAPRRATWSVFRPSRAPVKTKAPSARGRRTENCHGRRKMP